MTSRAPKHRTRPLLHGGIEFYMRANGQTMKGSAASSATYRDLRAIFEQAVGATLPDPDHKPPRYAAASKE
jgi:hypothetical protein